MFFRHHLQVFLSEVVSKKRSKLVKFKNLFNPNVTPPPSSFFLGGGVKKSSNKKSQSTRAKCTSDLAWSVQTRSEIVRNCLKRVKSCPKLAKESQKRAKKESKKRQKNVFSLLLDNILYRKRTWDRVPTNPGNPTNLWLSYGSAEGRT
jgi:hypothetical protein